MGGIVDDEVLLARAFLSRVAEPASIPVWDCVRRSGPVAAARLIRDGGGSEGLSAAVLARREHVDPHADLETAQRHGIRLVVPESDEWPHFAMAALERTGAVRPSCSRAEARGRIRRASRCRRSRCGCRAPVNSPRSPCGRSESSVPARRPRTASMSRPTGVRPRRRTASPSSPAARTGSTLRAHRGALAAGGPSPGVGRRPGPGLPARQRDLFDTLPPPGCWSPRARRARRRSGTDSSPATG